MRVYTPEHSFEQIKKQCGRDRVIFLGGTIDNGSAKDWQSEIIEYCINVEQNIKSGIANVDEPYKNGLLNGLLNKNTVEGIVLLNPRNPDWNSETKQTDTDPAFRKQVDWEQDCLAFADVVFLYFAKDSTSIISMSELGQYCNSGKLIVSADPTFWRRGNIEVLSRRCKFPLYNSLEEGFESALKSKLSKASQTRKNNR